MARYFLICAFHTITEYTLPIFTKHIDLITTALTISCIMGLSVGLGAVSDTFLLHLGHIHFMYVVIARLQHWLACTLYSLFLLFRGKKWNVLKERVDQEEYSLDQLLLGTVMFTCLIFLYPTVLFYYLLFMFVLGFLLSFIHCSF